MSSEDKLMPCEGCGAEYDHWMGATVHTNRCPIHGVVQRPAREEVSGEREWAAVIAEYVRRHKARGGEPLWSALPAYLAAMNPKAAEAATGGDRTPPFLSVPTFDDRSQERVEINGCLYLRADFAARRNRERLVDIAADFLAIDEASKRSKDDCRVFVDMRDWAPFIAKARAIVSITPATPATEKAVEPVAIKPCPWHPKSAVNAKSSSQFRHWVQCYGGCRGPQCSSEAEAIGSWNDRAPPAADVAALREKNDG